MAALPNSADWRQLAEEPGKGPHILRLEESKGDEARVDLRFRQAIEWHAILLACPSRVSALQPSQSGARCFRCSVRAICCARSNCRYS